MSRTLLLADDSVTIRRVIELTFADEDVDVIAVGDGRQAIDWITAAPPDIVLADIGMPERDGYEVSAFVKGDPALAHIPVVLLTGAFQPVDGDRARRAGCDAVLVKPFKPQIVISRVQELLDGTSSSALPPAVDSFDDTAPSAEGLVEVGDLREENDRAGLKRVAVPPPRVQRPEAVVEPFQLDTELTTDPMTASGAADEWVAPGSAQNATAIPDGDPLRVRLDEAFEGRPTESAETSSVEAVDAALAALRPEPAPPTSDSRADSLNGVLNALEGAPEQLDLDDFESRSRRSHASHELPALTLDEAITDVEQPSTEDVDQIGSKVDAVFDRPAVLTIPPPRASSPVELTTRKQAVNPGVRIGGRDAVTSVASSDPVPTPMTVPTSLVDSAFGGHDAPATQSTPVPFVAAAPPKPLSLVAAFAALLAAEQGDLDGARAVYPWPQPAVSGQTDAPEFADALVDRVTERVIERLSAGVTGELVAEVVSRVAERLVREEIERIKQV